jgi:hypothetical protein
MIDVATHSDERISLTTAVLLVQVENSTGKEDPDPDDDDTDADDDADNFCLPFDFNFLGFLVNALAELPGLEDLVLR